MTVTKIRTATRCTVHTMSDSCFKWLDDYLRQFDYIVGSTVEETYNNIMNLDRFKSGCATYLQARAFAEYYHEV